METPVQLAQSRAWVNGMREIALSFLKGYYTYKALSNGYNDIFTASNRVKDGVDMGVFINENEGLTKANLVAIMDVLNPIVNSFEANLAGLDGYNRALLEIVAEV